MGYEIGNSLRLYKLKELGFNPKTILDIGAHTGQFYTWSKNVWPDAFIWMIEANDCHEKDLKKVISNDIDRYTIATMGDIEREVTLYTRKDKPHTQGASYYKETNYWDIPKLVMEIPKTLQTLDSMFTDDSTFDLIKMDTQGSELDIIKGGKDLCSRAEYILLEVAVTQYNDNAPLENEVITFMNDFGFSEELTIGEHYHENEIIQKDIVFKNSKI